MNFQNWSKKKNGFSQRKQAFVKEKEKKERKNRKKRKEI